MFDENGQRIGFVLNGTTTYYYRFNLQGDVTGIYDTSGNLIAEYAYDAWGAPVSVTGSDLTLANLNPIRYRGYYYDAETGLYYVSSRYYDPEIGRWINADGYVSTGQDILGYNMFAYCGNNPINRKDPTGQFWITALIVAVVVTVTLCHATASKQFAKNDYKSNLEKEKGVSKNLIVRNQKSPTVGELKFGAGCVAENGCAAVAIHNVKVLKDVPSTLSESIYDIQKRNVGLLFDGKFGANSFVLDDILLDYGIQCETVNSSELLQSGLYLIAVWNVAGDITEGAHFVVFNYDGKDVMTYNGTKVHPSAYMNRYICGYRIK